MANKEENFFEEAPKTESKKIEEEFFPLEKPKPIAEEDIWGLEAEKKKEAEKAEVKKRMERLNKELEDIFAGKEASELPSSSEIEAARKRLEEESGGSDRPTKAA